MVVIDRIHSRYSRTRDEIGGWGGGGCKLIMCCQSLSTNRVRISSDNISTMKEKPSVSVSAKGVVWYLSASAYLYYTGESNLCNTWRSVDGEFFRPRRQKEVPTLRVATKSSRSVDTFAAL